MLSLPQQSLGTVVQQQRAADGNGKAGKPLAPFNELARQNMELGPYGLHARRLSADATAAATNQESEAPAAGVAPNTDKPASQGELALRLRSSFSPTGFRNSNVHGIER
jgi:hypothetical protein